MMYNNGRELDLTFFMLCLMLHVMNVEFEIKQKKDSG